MYTILYYLTQGDSLEDLTIRKQEIISHLQEEPMFIDSNIYTGSAAKGGYPVLSSVLASKSRSVESMPKHVSDMYVATRSTQFLDDLCKLHYLVTITSFLNAVLHSLVIDIKYSFSKTKLIHSKLFIRIVFEIDSSE